MATPRDGASDGAGVLLPRLAELTPRAMTSGSAAGSSASPSVAKRMVGWATPRGRPTPPACANADPRAEEVEDEGGDMEGEHDEGDGEPCPSVANALETLELLLRESAAASESARRRQALLADQQRRRAAEEQRREQARLASAEHMAATIRLLSDELERARPGAGPELEPWSEPISEPSSLGSGAVLPPVTAALRMPRGATTPTRDSNNRDEAGRVGGEADGEREGDAHRGRQALLSPRLRDSPLRARRQKSLLGTDNAVAAPSLRVKALAQSAELRVASRLVAGPTGGFLSSSPTARVAASFELPDAPSLDVVSSREEKLRALLLERTHWQREYAQMRDKVVEEKTRQVALFRRLDDARRDHLAQSGELEAALRAAHTEVELLRAQLAQARAAAEQLQQRADDVARRAWEEKQTLVCSIAETRHKFKEWKEGEAATLKAARDQAVHNLKTEYELKIARHHEEKQKLRDKVKDLEVSLRLLQRDRHMSAVELSQRKSTILNKDAAPPSMAAVMSSATAEAELIEAQSRIKELEALLDYAKEYQKRQESVIHMSEAAITRLMQERDVVALENLALEPAAAAMLPSLRGAVASSASATGSVYSEQLAGTSGEYAGYALRRPTRSRRPSITSTGSPSKAPSSFLVAGSASTTSSSTSGGLESPLSGRAPSSPPVQPASKLPDAPSTDPEKEILRRQSAVLSAELDKYRQLVVHSMDEIRSLKDQRRRSHQSLVATANGALGVATAKEQYLMSELLKTQGELAELKRRLSAKKRGGSGKGQGERKGSSFLDENDEGGRSDSDGGGESGSDSDSSDSSSRSGGGGSSSISVGERANMRESRGSLALADGERGREQAQHSGKDQAAGGRRSSSTTALLTDSSATPAPPQRDEDASADGAVPVASGPVKYLDLSTDITASGAAQVLQKQGKAFLARRAFAKKKLAIEKIKARYRGYLVRKNVEMLGYDAAPPRAAGAGGRALINSVSEAAQYKMRVVGPHHETVCDCRGHVFKVLIRVSKDPSLVLLQMLPSTQNASQRHLLADSAPEESHAVSFSRTATRAAYFHLFEVIAALPYEEETLVLEHTSEREIAAIVASKLRVVRISGEYKFMVDRNGGQQAEGGFAGQAPLGFGLAPSAPHAGTLLVELPVDPLQPARAVVGGGASAGSGEDGDEQVESTPEESRDLYCLIRDARLTPEEDAVAPSPAAAMGLLDASPRRSTDMTGSSRSSSGSAAEFLTPRQMRRRSMSSLGVIMER